MASWHETLVSVCRENIKYKKVNRSWINPFETCFGACFHFLKIEMCCFENVSTFNSSLNKLCVECTMNILELCQENLFQGVI